MLDIKFIRDNADLVKEAARKKHVTVDIDALITLDNRRRELTTQLEAKRAEQNVMSEKIAIATGVERETMIASMKALKDSLTGAEEELKTVFAQWQGLMVLVPNVPDITVPDGTSDADNQEIRTWGDLPQFSFEPKGHVELMERCGMIDLERGTKVAGFRGYFLTGVGAELSMAVWNFVTDHFRTHHSDYRLMMAPSLVRREPFMGTGYLPQSEEDLYKTQDGEYLAGTAEVGMMGYFMDEVLEEKNLPLKFLAFSPCFRREAGSHGKDTKGIVRVHEFFKIEQVVLCAASHEESVRHHEELTANAEALLQALEIPYHVVVNCGGDIGLGQVKKYDIEAWVPSEGKYRETHSSSYFHDFQSRRLNLRYKDAEGKMRFVHSLNNTAIATPRVLVPIVENNQQADGSIRIPLALRKYMGRDTIEPVR
jgi:seryl-tRNA synthetase